MKQFHVAGESNKFTESVELRESMKHHCSHLCAAQMILYSIYPHPHPLCGLGYIRTQFYRPQTTRVTFHLYCSNFTSFVGSLHSLGQLFNFTVSYKCRWFTFNHMCFIYCIVMAANLWQPLHSLYSAILSI